MLLHERDTQLFSGPETSSVVDAALRCGDIFGTTPVQAIDVVREGEESIGADGYLAEFLDP